MCVAVLWLQRLLLNEPLDCMASAVQYIQCKCLYRYVARSTDNYRSTDRQTRFFVCGASSFCHGYSCLYIGGPEDTARQLEEDWCHPWGVHRPICWKLPWEWGSSPNLHPSPRLDRIFCEYQNWRILVTGWSMLHLHPPLPGVHDVGILQSYECLQCNDID